MCTRAQASPFFRLASDHLHRVQTVHLHRVQTVYDDRCAREYGPWRPAGTDAVDPLEFLARVLVHIPDQRHVTTRHDGWYADRPRGMRDNATSAAADGPPAIVRAPRLAPTEATRRWAALRRQTVEEIVALFERASRQ